MLHLPPEIDRVGLMAACAQVIAVNACRGLLLSEIEEDPRVAALVFEVQGGGDVSVTLLGADGHPLGGYTL